MAWCRGPRSRSRETLTARVPAPPRSHWARRPSVSTQSRPHKGASRVLLRETQIILAEPWFRGDPMTRNDVLIIGAGPSGLFAASELIRYGVDVRLIEREVRLHR